MFNKKTPTVTVTEAIVILPQSTGNSHVLDYDQVILTAAANVDKSLKVRDFGMETPVMAIHPHTQLSSSQPLYVFNFKIILISL